jgi:hypothetical protein
LLASGAYEKTAQQQQSDCKPEHLNVPISIAKPVTWQQLSSSVGIAAMSIRSGLSLAAFQEPQLFKPV